MAAIVFVRVKSPLDARELENRVLERRPRFRKVPGLVQKVYGRDESSGDMCGIYSFESKEALDGFRDSALAQTMAAAHEAAEVRREAFELLYSLYPDRGPIAG